MPPSPHTAEPIDKNARQLIKLIGFAEYINVPSNFRSNPQPHKRVDCYLYAGGWRHVSKMITRCAGTGGTCAIARSTAASPSFAPAGIESLASSAQSIVHRCRRFCRKEMGTIQKRRTAKQKKEDNNSTHTQTSKQGYARLCKQASLRKAVKASKVVQARYRKQGRTFFSLIGCIKNSQRKHLSLLKGIRRGATAGSESYVAYKFDKSDGRQGRRRRG